MRVRFRCPIRRNDRRNNYCLPDFLFDRSPENKKQTGSRACCLNFPHTLQASTVNQTRSITFGRFLGVGLRFTPLSESSRLLAGCIAVRFQIINSCHYLIHASAPCAFLVSTCYRIKKNVLCSRIHLLRWCGLLITDLPFLHFFCIVLVCSQDLSPFLRLRVRDRMLVFESHSDHWPFTYLHDEELPDAASADAKRQ